MVRMKRLSKFRRLFQQSIQCGLRRRGYCQRRALAVTEYVDPITLEADDQVHRLIPAYGPDRMVRVEALLWAGLRVADSRVGRLDDPASQLSIRDYAPRQHAQIGQGLHPGNGSG